jgi:hypothetical protein
LEWHDGRLVVSTWLKAVCWAEATDVGGQSGGWADEVGGEESEANAML